MKLTIFFMFRKDHKKAIDSLKKAISLNPNNADGYLFLGSILIYSDELEKAVENINKAFRLNPLPPARYHFWLGFAYQNSRQFDKAIEAYSKSIELDPDYWLPRIGMVVVYGHISDKIKAQDAILEVLRIRPGFIASKFLKMQPYKNETTRDFIGEGLSKAGLVD